MMRDNHGKVVGRPQAPEAQPWFWTITSLSICALLAVSSTAIAQNISAEDFDLACAVTAGAVFGSNPKAERDASKMVWTFYLGRLTGRDDKRHLSRSPCIASAVIAMMLGRSLAAQRAQMTRLASRPSISGIWTSMSMTS